MGTMEDFMGSTTSLALSSLTWPHQKSRRNVAHSKLVNIEDIEPAFMGSWMDLSKPQDSSGRGPIVGEGFTLGELMEKQRFLQVTPKKWRPLSPVPHCSKRHNKHALQPSSDGALALMD